MEEIDGFCLKVFFVVFVNELVVEIYFLIVMCLFIVIVIDFVVILRFGMLGRGIIFGGFVIYVFRENRLDIG